MVDVVGADIYEPKGSSMDATWSAFKDLFDGQKLIALSETGALVLPSSVRAFQTMWSWFNTWDITKYDITQQEIKQVYTDATVVTLDELPDWRSDVGVSRLGMLPHDMTTGVVIAAVVVVLVVVAVAVTVVLKLRLAKSNVPSEATQLKP